MNSLSVQEHQAGKSIQLLLAALVLLGSIYCLTYSGRFSTDDEHILASRSLSFAFHGNFASDQVLGNTRILAYSSMPETEASQSLGVEPLQAVLGAGLARLALLSNSGFVQMLFLLNIFATILTAGCVWISIRVLGYPDRTALITTILFGLGTQVWPFSRTYFRDPLAMLCLAFAWLCIIVFNQASSSSRLKFWAGLGTGLGLLLGILAKNSVAIAVPSFLILLIPFLRLQRSRGIIRTFSTQPVRILSFLLVISGLLIFILTAQGPLARFSFKYYWQLLLFFITSPHPHFFEALLGPLFSPGKSIFLFSPLLILSIIALAQKRRETLAACIYALLLIIFQALFYDNLWWGSLNWGLRFILPAIPLLMIGAAPVINRMLNSSRGKVVLALLGSISVLVQIIGTAVPLGEYYRSLLNISPAAAGTIALWNLKYSAIVWNFKWILSGNYWDLAILREGFPGILLGAILIGQGCLAWLFLRAHRTWLSLVLAGSMSISILFVPIFSAQDPAYFFSRDDFRDSEVYLKEQALPSDGLVISSYGAPVWYYWMNWGDPELSWISLPFSYSFSSELPVDIQKILSQASASYDRVWLLLPCDSPSSELLLANKTNINSLELLTEQTYQNGDCRTSLLLFLSKP